jgi:hypothetical protein
MSAIDRKTVTIDVRCSATRRVPMKRTHSVGTHPTASPEQGDVVVGKVLSTGQHARIEIVGGREVLLRPGLFCALVLGRRYSTWEFHGEIPETLRPGDVFHLLNTGGISGVVYDKNQLAMNPTRLEFIGYLSHAEGKKQNISHYTLCPGEGNPLPTVIMVVGADMEVGKTTSAAWAIRELVQAGHKTTGVKLTGTSRMKDLLVMRDGGAAPILDFVDFGLPSTFGVQADVMARMFQQMRKAGAEKVCEYMVVEVADGLFQPETYAILTNESIMKDVSLVLFAAEDSVAAYGGSTFLKRIGHPPDLLTGLFTASPLKTREVQSHCSTPIFSTAPDHQKRFLESARQVRNTAELSKRSKRLTD